MASPLSPSQITDTNYNSYFCKNCGTRLIHTTPVSSPTFSIVIPVFKYCLCCTYLYCSLRLSCSYVFFYVRGTRVLVCLILTWIPPAEQKSRLRKRRMPRGLGLENCYSHLDKIRGKQ